MNRLVLFLLAAVAMTSWAEEPDKRTPIQRYEGNTNFPLLMCALTMKNALLRAEIDKALLDTQAYEACVSDGKAKAKPALEAALRSTKKPKAQAALKSVHVAFLTALDGIAPDVSERRIAYEQRQTMLKGKLTEAWARFEVEQ